MAIHWEVLLITLGIFALFMALSPNVAWRVTGALGLIAGWTIGLAATVATFAVGLHPEQMILPALRLTPVRVFGLALGLMMGVLAARETRVEQEVSLGIALGLCGGYAIGVGLILGLDASIALSIVTGGALIIGTAFAWKRAG